MNRRLQGEQVNASGEKCIYGGHDTSNISCLPIDFLSPASFWIPDWIQESAWIEHVPFAFWLIDTLRPRTIVELGTEYGVSYMAFCQAVCHLGLETKCFAIDTWKGDEQTGLYGEDVFETLSRAHQGTYSHFSRLIRATFDESSPYFEDGSIDLLHIDGLHTYEAVKHDFENWHSKLSPSSVVLFHDTNVRERDFGVFKLWSELRNRWDGFEFFHGHGLGILGVGTNLAVRIKNLFAASEIQAVAVSIRKIYADLGAGLGYRQKMEPVRQALKVQAAECEQLNQELEQRSTRISRLEETLFERTTICERLQEELVARKSELSQFQTETDTLKRQIDSIYSSRCWRLTWPIRLLHEQSIEIRKIVGSHFKEAFNLQHGSFPFKHTHNRDKQDDQSGYPLFDVRWYLEHNSNILAARRKPLEHYLQNGWKEGRKPHPLFDVEWYLERYPDVKAAGAEPLGHYLRNGWKEGRSPHPLFDVKWYLERYPDVKAAGAEPLGHYLRKGWKEGRDPHPLFSVSRYLEANPDVKDSGIEPLTHYVLFKVTDSRASRSEPLTNAVDYGTLFRKRFPNLMPLRIFSSSAPQQRVNMITDSIAEGSFFGGVGTAIILSVLLSERLNCPLRIVTRTQQPEPQNVYDLLLANDIKAKSNIEFLFADIGNAPGIY